MFKTSGFEAELIASMQRNLVSARPEHKISFEKLAKAADYINAAAVLLDDTGFASEAETLTKVLERLANDENASKSHLDTTEEALKALRDAEEASEPKDVILEPLSEQEVLVEEKPEFLQFESLLGKEKHKKMVEESPEYLEFQSLAAKIKSFKKKDI